MSNDPVRDLFTMLGLPTWYSPFSSGNCWPSKHDVDLTLTVMEARMNADAADAALEQLKRMEAAERGEAGE
jgi:hypothetical protein